jgi:hypothetical protein
MVRRGTLKTVYGGAAEPIDLSTGQLRKAMLHWLNLEPRPSMLSTGVSGAVASLPGQRSYL